MLVHDVNDDGYQDIIYGHGHSFGLTWIEQRNVNGKREFINHNRNRDEFIRVDPGQFHTLVLADVNQDGRLDFLTGKRLRGHAGGDRSAYAPLGVFWFEMKNGKFVEHFELSGTSMATPVVAGAVALMLEQDPSLSPATVKARLMVSADKEIDDSPYARGAGTLDLEELSEEVLLRDHPIQVCVLGFGLVALAAIYLGGGGA